MENTLVNDPRIGFIVLILLTLSDLFLGRRTGSKAAEARSEHFEYETRVPRDMGSTAYFAFILLKISPAFLITLVWAAARASNSDVIAAIYAGLLGFTFALYLLINLRHFESMMINSMVGRFSEDISGKVFIKRRFSLGLSTIQIISVFLILLIVAIIEPSPLFIGFVMAPVALIIRNIVLIKM